MRGEKKAFYGQWVGEYKLSFALERLEPIRSKNEEEMVIPVRFTVLAVGGQSVKVDTVSIDLLKTGEDLVVMTVGTIPFNATPGANTCDEANSWSLCRLAAIVRSRVSVMMAKANKWSGCHKKGPFGHIGGKKHGGKHGKHGKYGKHHRQHSQAQHYGHMIHQTLRFFVIPALLGVIGGLMASAVGMIIGQIIVALWTRFGRGGKKGNASQRAQLVEVMLVEDEKDALLDSELPPQYEVPPQYQDIEAVAVEEKQ